MSQPTILPTNGLIGVNASGYPPNNRLYLSVEWKFDRIFRLQVPYVETQGIQGSQVPASKGARWADSLNEPIMGNPRKPEKHSPDPIVLIDATNS